MATINLSASLSAKATTSANLTVVDQIAAQSIILAQHYTALCGETLTAAANANAAKMKAGYLWGIGYGDRGYGQTSYPLSAANATAGSNIAQEWNALRSTVDSLATWQITNVGSLIASSTLNAGQVISSQSPLSIASALSAVDARRLSFDIANMTLTPAITTTRATPWGTSSTGIQAVLQVQFATEDDARYFFNTGGSIRISLDHPNTTTARNTSWNTALKNFNMSFDAHKTKMLAGNYGTPANIGYYELTNSYQTIVDGTDTGITLYGNNDFTVEARSIDIVGLNGAKGKTLQFKIYLFNDSITSPADAVAAGTVANLSHLRATSGISLAAPTTSTIQAF